MSEDKQASDAEAPSEWTGTIQIRQTSPVQNQSRNSNDNRIIYCLGLTWYEFVSACIQAGIFLVTILYVVTAFLQWRAIKAQWQTMEKTVGLTEQSIQLTKQSLELSQRAWVLPVRVSKIDLLPDQPIKISLFLQNSGHTPAVFSIQLGQATAAAVEPFSNPPYFHPPIQGIIAPADSLPVDFGLGPFSKALIDEVNGKQKRLYVYGTLQYGDPFATERPPTTFCFYYVEGGTFTMCPTYNVVK